MSISQYFRKNIELYGKYRLEFADVFGTALKPYFDNLLGFDIIAFDEKVLQPKVNESSAQATYRKYGNKGLKILFGLLETPSDEQEKLRKEQDMPDVED